jgi:hypothetical protein
MCPKIKKYWFYINAFWLGMRLSRSFLFASCNDLELNKLGQLKLNKLGQLKLN